MEDFAQPPRLGERPGDRYRAPEDILPNVIPG